jgi:hypothetical protein
MTTKQSIHAVSSHPFLLSNAYGQMTWQAVGGCCKVKLIDLSEKLNCMFIILKKFMSWSVVDMNGMKLQNSKI